MPKLMPRYQRLALVTGTSLSLTLLAGCGGSSSDADDDTSRSTSVSKVEVVTSIISDPAQDPHSYEAGTRNQLALSRAKVVIENGGGYDDFVDRMLKSGGTAPAEVINAVEVSGRTAPEGGELDEHIWYDFPGVAKIADRLATALGKADPADAATFTKNAETFKTGLTPLETKEADIKKKHGGGAIGITEPVPLYQHPHQSLRHDDPLSRST